MIHVTVNPQYSDGALCLLYFVIAAEAFYIIHLRKKNRKLQSKEG